MTLPEGAIFEDQPAGGVAIYDVTALLPKHKKRRYEERDAGGIVRVYNHHSGALGKSGYAGLLGSTRYGISDKEKMRTIRGKKRKYIQKGWPGQPYTFWYSFEPDRDEEGRIVIYRANFDATRSFHTGKDANGHGVGVAWQGNLTKQKPSDAQIEMAEAHYPWFLARYPLSDDRPFSYHAEAGDFGGKPKPTCPGPHVKQFVRDYRERMKSVGFDEDEVDPVGASKPGLV